MSHRPHLAVIGTGMAAQRLVEELLARAPRRYRITLFGAEPEGGYNRILLSGLLAGDKRLDEVVTHPPAWFEERGITLRTEDPVVEIRPGPRRLLSASGLCLDWDRLVLATGARPVMPPLPGIALPGVVAFRTVRDVELMLAAAARGGRAVVIGGGVLGLEAAWGLARRGMAVTVVHPMPWLMERQLDRTAAGLLRSDLERQGITCRTGRAVTAIVGRDRVAGVVLEGGERGAAAELLPADLVVVAAGIRPEADLARRAGLEVRQGVVVDGAMRCSHPDIFALGDCAEHDGQCFGLVAPLGEMARLCAGHLAGEGGTGFVAPATATRLKIPGIDLLAAGAPPPEGEAVREIIDGDPAQGLYRKLVLRQGRLVQFLLYGAEAEADSLWRCLRDGTDLGSPGDWDALRRKLPGDGAPLPDDHPVCHCHGVTAGALRAAIAARGLTSLEQVSRCTRAGTGCGQCAGVTARILAESLGGETAAVPPAAVWRRRGFRFWHHGNAALMLVLTVTGLALHFPGSPAALLDFAWSYRLHQWAGLGLCGAFLLLGGLTLGFRRRWRADLEGLTLFALVPLLALTGLAFLWPALVSRLPGGLSALAWLALAHGGLTIAMLMYLIHHLSRAPWRWWRRR